MKNPLEEVARIANDPTLPRRRRLHLIQEFLSAPPETQPGAPLPRVWHRNQNQQPTNTKQDATTRSNPASEQQQLAEKPYKNDPASRKVRLTATKKSAPKPKAQPRKRRLGGPAKMPPVMTNGGRIESFCERLRREHPAAYRAWRDAENAARRAAYDPENERERKARKEALHPGREAARKREYARTHRESRNRIQRAWLAAHPEKAAEYRRRYWEKRKALGLPDRHEEAAKRWAALCADEEAHVAFNAERAAYRRKKRPHKRDYKPRPSRMHHAFERYCSAFAPGGAGASGVGFARGLWRERNPK